MAARIGTPGKVKRVDVLLTAQEAFPVLERAFLGARTEIWASFRVFDLSTKLRSTEARQVGECWFDLIVHTLRRGIRIHMAIADFDPVAWAEGHRGAWRSVRMFVAAAEIAGPSAKLHVIPALHPARTGLLPRLMFWPAIIKKLTASARRLNDLTEDERRAAMRELPGLRRWLTRRRDGRYRPRYLSLPPLCPATHHQKLAVFDRHRVYIGGLDLDDRRFDTPNHDRQSEETWHDVQLMMEGAIAKEAQTHLETFADVAAGRLDPAPQQQLLRTISRRRTGIGAHFGPETVAHEILAAHEMLARRAERLIYLETQYFRDRRLARLLAEVGRSRPELGMILILPGAPDDVAFEGNSGLDARFGEFLQAQSLRILARGFHDRLFVGGAAQPRRAGTQIGNGRDRLEGAPIIYIHAKVSVFDESSAVISSANLNGRSLKWDTEAGVLLEDAQDVGSLRRKVMAHWLPEDAGPGFFAAEVRTVAAWRDLALTNARTAPEARRGFLLPYDLKAAERFGQPMPVVPDEMV